MIAFVTGLTKEGLGSEGGSHALVDFAGNYVGEQFFTWAIKQGFLAAVGTSGARADKKVLRRAFQDAGRSALSQAYNDPQALNDEESARALAEYITSYLTSSPVGEHLLKFAAARDSSRAAAVIALIEDDFALGSLPFSMNTFLATFIPELGQKLAGMLRERGLTERLLFDSVDELFRRLDEQTVVSRLSGYNLAFVEQAKDKVSRMPAQELPEAVTLPAGSISGPAHYQHFVGREGQLKAIAEALKSEHREISGRRPSVVINGLGGIGKTQLASEFVYLYGQYFLGGVYWLNFSDAQNLPNEVAQCGGPGRMELHDNFHDLPLKDQVNAVWGAWQSELPRLLVFDNCEDEDLLRKWTPPTGGCHVLATSQRELWDPTLNVTSLPLLVFSRDQSIALLTKHRPDISAENGYAQAIAKELGDLPLAIDLAGRYMRQYGERPEEYLEELQGEDLLHHESLGRFTGISPTDHNMSVWRTFALTYRRLDVGDQAGQLANRLLARASYFAPGDSIPTNYLIATLRLPEENRTTQRRAMDGLRRLRELGLLRAVANDTLLSMHRLLVAFVRGEVSDDEAQSDTENLIASNEVGKAFQDGRLEEVIALLPHLRYLADSAWTRDDVRVRRACYLYGGVMYKLTDYQQGIRYTKKAYEAINASNESDQFFKLRVHRNLGMMYKASGDWDEIPEHWEQALLIFNENLKATKKAMGASNLETAYVHYGLGSLLSSMERYSEAFLHYQKALEIRRRKKLEEYHPDFIESLNNMGELMLDMGDLEQAEQYLTSAEDNTHIALEKQARVRLDLYAKILRRLGDVARLQGDHEKAYTFYQRAYATYGNTLGYDHRDSLAVHALMEGLSR